MCRLDNPNENVLTFALNIVPPSVNHYVTHGGGHHKKTPEAEAFERDFLRVLPPNIRERFVTGDRFSVTLHITPAPGGKGDIDNYPKLLLDCIGKAGMLRDSKGKNLTDAKIKILHLYLDDDTNARDKGPRVSVTICPLS